MNQYEKQVLKLSKAAKAASFELALLSTEKKARALKAMASALLSGKSQLLRENKKDVKASIKAGLLPALVDRLTLNERRINSMAESILQIAELPDPVGEVLETRTRPNGLVIEKVRTPIGVVAIIYESRPNVTADCAALCLKSGNAAVLKGGKESIHSNMAIYSIIQDALKKSHVPVDAVGLLQSTDREAVKVLLGLTEYIDIVVPRGGEGLIRFVAENSRIPVVKHYKGVCHTYVSRHADLAMAENICFNAKVQRPGVCNAMEKMLVHEKVSAKFLPAMIKKFEEAGVEIRGDEIVRRIVPQAKKAREADWTEEYLDLILAVKVVKDVQEAIDHINAYGSRHSDAIVTSDPAEAEAFLDGVDSACVYVNASTRFTDGFEFGLGAEIGISTDKLHVRGPMGIEGLTSYKYKIRGKGQTRQ